MTEAVGRAVQSPAQRWLGVEVVSAGDGEVVLEMTGRPEMANRSDVLHGGFISFLADSAMAAAMRGVLPAGARQYSFDLKMSFVATGRIGERLRAVARVLHAGRRTGVAECRLTGERGRLVATATASFAVYPPGT